MSVREIDLDPVYTETLTVERFLAEIQKRENDMESVRVLPAKLGHKGFGRIVVKWKTPIYKSKLNDLKQENE